MSIASAESIVVRAGAPRSRIVRTAVPTSAVVAHGTDLAALQRMAGNRAVTQLLSKNVVAQRGFDDDRVARRRATANLPSTARLRTAEDGRRDRREQAEGRRRETRQDAVRERRRIGEEQLMQERADAARAVPKVAFQVRAQIDHREGGSEDHGESGSEDRMQIDSEELVQRHELFAEVSSEGRIVAMIASLPLPVADFLVDLRARFDSLLRKGTDTAGVFKDGSSRLIRVLPKLGTGAKHIGTAFLTVHDAATNVLTTTNERYNDLTTTSAERREAEQNLAMALAPVITKVLALAARLGRHYANPGNTHQTRREDRWVSKVNSGAPRYAIEGLVAQYEKQPDFQGAAFDRDHQPHNALLEAVAAQPEFAGRAITRITPGHSKLAWTIMLHHDRHVLGRTYGSKGEEIVSAFHVALAAKRADLASEDLMPVAPSDQAIRDFCIEHLIESISADVQAMKDIAHRVPGSYDDITSLEFDEDGTENATAQNKLIEKVKQQITDGEDRMLQTVDAIRAYAD